MRVSVCRSSGAVFLVCGLLTASLMLLVAEGVASHAAGGQLRRGAVEELAPGKLLVAARHLPDPNFADSVVLLADFSADGAMGLIVNRPTDVTLERVFPGFDRSPGGKAAVFFGGPVSVPGVLALLRSSTSRTDSRLVTGDVYLVNTREVLEKLVKEGASPERVRVYAGYAGWGAGQLDGETAQGAWHVFDGDADVVFDPDPDTVWRRQIRRAEGLIAERGGREPAQSARSATAAPPPAAAAMRASGTARSMAGNPAASIPQ
jgi:putative transcriptional regulator